MKTKYRWGGASKDGVDCSAFTQHICRALGSKDIPRTAREQFAKGRPVSMAQLEPGDLIFWGGTQKALKPGVASHVGVYIGNGKMRHAGSKGVTEVSLATYSPSSKAVLLGARRF